MSYDGQPRHHLLIWIKFGGDRWRVWLHCNGCLEATPPPRIPRNTRVELTLGDCVQ